MTTTTPPPSNGAENQLMSAATGLIERLLDAGINGLGPWKGAVEVAEEHRRAAGDTEEAIRRLILTHVRLAACSGFVTGVGGLITLPVTLPAGVTGLYVIATRMAAGIAYLRGYDIHDDEVRSVILVCLLGSAGAGALKKAGIAIGEKVVLTGVKRVPGVVILKINQAVGFRLLTKFGTKGALNLSKAVPLVGGPVGATFDGTTCRGIAKYARSSFPTVPVSTVASF